MNASIFKSVVNPVSGTTEWVLEDEEYDYVQEIARSGYADMLHDEERNIAFRDALDSTIKAVKATGKSVHVLDIGTGTGLLSMMAVRLGADKVTACEAFLPMAITAENIMLHNKVKQFIQLVKKRSTDMEQEDMFDGERADICVAEVFDTELIGEGALRTFKEAHERLLKTGAHIIPASGTVYAMPIHSPTLRRWEKPEHIRFPKHGITIVPPPDCLDCAGTAAVHDVQMDQIPTDLFETLADKPVEVFHFNFESLENMSEFKRAACHTVDIKEHCSSDKISNGGHVYANGRVQDSVKRQVDAVLLWWVLDMDGTGNIMLSTEPKWIKKDGVTQWRDHWMQAIYYLPTPLPLEQGQEIFSLHASHDEYSFWFAAGPSMPLVANQDGGGDTASPVLPASRPVCTCGLHSICSRSNLGRFNDAQRYSKWADELSKVVPSKTCLCISDCSILPLVAASLGAKHVFCLESNHLAADIVRKYAAANDMSSIVTVLNKSVADLRLEDLDCEKVDIIFGDPFFFASILPWENLALMHCVHQLVDRGMVDEDVLVLPRKMRVQFMAIEMDDLWKIRAPIGYVEDCNLKKFDDILLKAIKLADGTVESHPLWEYPCRSLSHPETLIEIPIGGRSLRIGSTDQNAEKIVGLSQNGTLNGVAIWTECVLQDAQDEPLSDTSAEGTVISDGLVANAAKTGESGQTDTTPVDSVLGGYAKWDYNSKQGVHFMNQPFYQLSADKRRSLVGSVEIDGTTGDFRFKFKVQTEK